MMLIKRREEDAATLHLVNGNLNMEGDNATQQKTYQALKWVGFLITL
jgi:hypothetical protein